MEEIKEAVPDDHHQAVPHSVLEDSDGPAPPVGAGAVVVAVVPAAAGAGGNSDSPPAGGSCKLRIIRRGLRTEECNTCGMGNISQSRVAREVS